MHSTLVRNLLFPLHEKLLQRPTFPFLSAIERTQWLTRQELESSQADKLTQLLQSAMRHSPWHAQRIRAAGIDPFDHPVDQVELARLPLMTKADAQQNREHMVWKEVPGGAHLYNTGGSSGSPLIFYFGRLRQASDAASRMRARRWWGIQPGEKEVLLWGSPVELGRTDRIKQIRDRLFNQLVLNAFAMTPSAMDDYLDAIRHYRPTCIYGYASSLALLAAHARSRSKDLRLDGLKAVFCTGEPLYPQQKEIIEAVFGVPAAGEFGSRDSGFIAHASPEGQMLVNSESVLLEVLDPMGKPVTPGELGEAVITGLCSEAQPFIRYRTGDMLRLSDEPCRAGRGLHVLASVEGRTTDFVVRGDGTIMHALAVIYVARAVEGVGEFKIIQHSLQRLEVRVVPNARWNADAPQQIIQGMQARLGNDVEVVVTPLDEIAPEASGKHRYVISKVELPESLKEAAG